MIVIAIDTEGEEVVDLLVRVQIEAQLQCIAKEQERERESASDLRDPRPSMEYTHPF